MELCILTFFLCHGSNLLSATLFISVRLFFLCSHFKMTKYLIKPLTFTKVYVIVDRRQKINSEIWTQFSKLAAQ